MGQQRLVIVPELHGSQRQQHNSDNAEITKMGRDIEQEAKQFFKDHCNLTDTNTTPDCNNQSYRYAHEQIADDLARSLQGLSKSEITKFCDTLAKQSAITAGEYAEFEKSSDGHLHVKTRGFDIPINFGMSKDSDLNDVMQARARRGGYGTDQGAGPKG